jgi:hypothetical protein
MTFSAIRILVCCVAALSLACGGDGDGGGGSDGVGAGGTGGGNAPVTVASCDACNEAQVCVRTFDAEDTIECMPIPMVCNAMADCFDEACSVAMYDLCGDDFINNGCSDTFPPTVISCNR